MTSLHAIARVLGGDVVGHQVMCPGPGHSRKDRSLSVRMSLSAPDGFVVHSHCGDNPLDAKDYVRRVLGWEAFGSDRREPPAVATAKPVQPDTDELAKIERAQIWREGRDPRGTSVEVFLKSRGLTLPDEVAGEAIRFHERCPWRDKETGRTIFVPCMLGAMRSIATEEVTGVHRTRLTPDGQKVDRRMLGKASGAAIMLCPFSAVGAGIALAEGIESALAGWQLGWSNVWALGSCGGIASFPVLAGVQSLVLLCEEDEANRRAVDTVAERYDAAGREVILVRPSTGNDLNDAVREARA